MSYRIDDNGWTWMPVEDILRDTHSAIDFPEMDEINWDAILNNKCGDTGFMHLVYSIMENGWQSAVGWEDGCITEGHHRICAAILLCEDEIPTTENGTSWYERRNGYTSDIVDAHSNWDDPQPLYLED